MKKTAIISLCLLTAVTVIYGHTYWTADGRQHTLETADTEEGQRIIIPSEAVAADLRDGLSPEVHVDVSQANPNCLYYLGGQQALPQGMDAALNLIQGQQAASIRVVDTHDYYCPLAFHADFVSFLMRPSYNSDDERRGRGFSETLMLPFHVSHACLYDVNGDAGIIHADKLKMLRYEGHHADTLSWSALNAITQTAAYEPYILGVYIGSRLLFVGENINVPPTPRTDNSVADINFVGTAVGFNLPAGTFRYDWASESFRPSEAARIEPFRGYMAKRDKEDDGDLYLPADCWGPQGHPSDAAAIGDEPTRAPRTRGTTPHNLQGHEADRRQLPKGIYIIDGRKVVVK